MRILKFRSWLGALNFLFFQWFGYRLAYSFDEDGKPVSWTFIKRKPLAGWICEGGTILDMVVKHVQSRDSIVGASTLINEDEYHLGNPPPKGHARNQKD